MPYRNEKPQSSLFAHAPFVKVECHRSNPHSRTHPQGMRYARDQAAAHPAVPRGSSRCLLPLQIRARNARSRTFAWRPRVPGACRHDPRRVQTALAAGQHRTGKHEPPAIAPQTGTSRLSFVGATDSSPAAPSKQACAGARVIAPGSVRWHVQTPNGGGSSCRVQPNWYPML